MKRIITLGAILLIFTGARSQAWIEVGTGTHALDANYIIWSVISDTAGNIYAAGGFTDSASRLLGSSYVSMWNGNSWSQLGSLNAGNTIYALTHDVAGNIYAAGDFLDPAGYQYVAKWNGSSWSELGTDSVGLDALATIYCLTTDPSGNVYAAGDFNDSLFGYGHEYVAMWNGSQWSEVGLDSITGLNADSSIYTITTDRHGNLYAAGAFADTMGYKYVAKWNGSVWTPLGDTVWSYWRLSANDSIVPDTTALRLNGAIKAMITDTAGNVYIGGRFTDSSGLYYIAKWNGQQWTELISGTNQTSILGEIDALTMDSVGNIYAGGWIPDSNGNFYIVVVWNGTQLLVANDSGSNPLNANAQVNTMCTDKFGNIYAAGFFYDSSLYQYVAEFTGNIPPGTGISDISPYHLNVYPNPASGTVFIQADHLQGSSTIELVDGLGRVLCSRSADGARIQTQLDVSSYAPGIYTLLLRDADDATLTRRIVKE